MKECLKCKKQFGASLQINGKKHNLQNRKYCIDCSPYGRHNTRDLTSSKGAFSNCQICSKDLCGNQKKFCSKECKGKYYYSTVGVSYPAIIEYQKTKGLERKIEFIKELGGKCSVCTYNKNISALHFHHKDENLKLFNIDSRACTGRKLSDLKAEVAKCVLLCANCHSEHHNPRFNNLL